MSKKIIFILIILFSCNNLRNSIGKSNDIIVVTSPEDKLLIKPILDNLFGEFIHTPQQEYLYNLKYKNSWEFIDYKYHKNIIIASINFPEDSTGDVLYQKFEKNYKQNPKLFQLNDLYAKNQKLTIINALDSIEFYKILNENKNWVIKENNLFFENDLNNYIFNNGENIALSDSIFDLLGVSIRLQIDYKMIKIDTSNSFVWLGRGYPYRWITLNKSNNYNMTSHKDYWNQYILDLNDLMPSLKITNHYRIINKDANRSALIMRGIYEHDESSSGGPFVVYIFDLKDSNEVILISGFVNHPGHEKMILLKEIEIMAQTIFYGD